MENSILNLAKSVVLIILILFGPKIKGQSINVKDCSNLALEYDNTRMLRIRLVENRNYIDLDSLFSAHLNQFNVHCPCSNKSGEVTWRKTDLQFNIFDRRYAFELINEKIEKCRNVNDTLTLFLLGRRAIYYLRNDDYFNMKKDLDEAIDIGEKKFYPSYKDLFIARMNLGLYYQWKRDYLTSLNIHIQNENYIKNVVFSDTSAHITNLEYIRNIGLEIDEQEIIETYSGELKNLVKGSKFEKRVFNGSNEALLDYFIKKGDYVKSEYYFNFIDTTSYNDYFKALPLIRYLIVTGKHTEAIQRLDHLDVLFKQEKVPSQHFARVNVALERLKVTEIDQPLVSYLTSSIHNNYKNLINVKPNEQDGNIKTIRDKYTAVINRLIERKKNTFLPIVYDRLHNIKNASSAYYTKISMIIENSQDENLKKDYAAYKLLCSGLNKGLESDSLEYLTSKIQNRLYDLGIKWHNDISLLEVQAKLTDSEVFLDFYQTEKINGKEEIYLFVVSKDKVGFVHYKNVLDTLSNQKLSANYVNNSKKNKALYDFLLKPIQPYLVGKKKVLISPDGVFSQIALDILSPIGSKSQILGDIHEIIYIENSRSLFENTKHHETNQNYLIIGGIQYYCTEATDMLASNHQKNNVKRSETQYLEGSKRELDLLTIKLRNKNIPLQSFSGCDASKDSISPAMENQQITNIHISTHGMIDTSGYTNQDRYFINNSKSQLLLAKVNDQNNAGLTAIEIINQNHTNKNLVFLSACNTGIGTYMAGFGNASVANAFKKAGARQVVATLWPIPDDLTVLLCDYFYDHYLTNHDANEALKFAQNQLKKQGFPPEKWAAFRVMN